MINLSLGLILLPAVHMPAGTYPLALCAGYFLSRLCRDVKQKGRRVVDPAPWLIVVYGLYETDGASAGDWLVI
jgi:hypothetical protein